MKPRFSSRAGQTRIAREAFEPRLRVKVTESGGAPTSVQLVDNPNTPGIVGAFNPAIIDNAITAGEISAIPEPAIVPTGLALFVLGAAGVREHRRRRQLAA